MKNENNLLVYHIMDHFYSAAAPLLRKNWVEKVESMYRNT